MINLNLLQLLNNFSSGIVLIIAVLYLIFYSKELKSVYHFIYWLLNFIFLFSLNIEYFGIIKFNIYHSDYILLFIPVFGYIYFFSLIFNKKRFYLFLLLIIPVVSCYFNFKIILFTVFYNLIFWLILLLIVYFTFFLKKRNNIENKKINNYIFIWINCVVFGFLPYIVINLILTFIKRYPIHILTILPVFIALSSFLIFLYYYKIYTNYNSDLLKKSSNFEKHGILEKIAGSLIHEIKNPIAAIQSLIQQIKNRYPQIPEETMHKYIDIIEKDLDRIKNLSESFLKTYKKDNELQMKSTDIYLASKSINDLIKFELMKREINFVLDKSLINKKVLIGNSQFRQILLNLIYNSIEANSKSIKISSLMNNDFIEIFIEDDGDGIKFYNLKNIFKPFFTTKNEGVGIGLSICENILLQYSGEIKLVSSKEGKTIFKFSLPSSLNNSTEEDDENLDS